MKGSRIEYSHVLLDPNNDYENCPFLPLFRVTDFRIKLFQITESFITRYEGFSLGQSHYKKKIIKSRKNKVKKVLRESSTCEHFFLIWIANFDSSVYWHNEGYYSIHLLLRTMLTVHDMSTIIELNWTDDIVIHKV